MKAKLRNVCGGFAVGVVNGLLGAGGGMIGVPILRMQTQSQCRAQANCVLLIFVLSLVSAAVYLFKGHVTFGDVGPLLPTGILGAVLGATVLKKIPDNIMRKIFALFMIWAGIRLLRS